MKTRTSMMWMLAALLMTACSEKTAKTATTDDTSQFVNLTDVVR